MAKDCCLLHCQLPPWLEMVLLSGRASRFSSKLCARREKSFPLHTRSIPTHSFVLNPQACALQPSFCPAMPTLPSHLPSLFAFSLPCCLPLPTAIPPPHSLFRTSPFGWISLPSIGRTRGSKGAKPHGLGGGIHSPVCLPLLPQAAVTGDQRVRQK